MAEVQVPGLHLRHWPAWLAPSAAAELLERLQLEVPWKQEAITLYGRRHLLPRLTCWMADPGCGYSYSGLANVIEPWSPAAAELREALHVLTGWRFNSLLLNRYRDGRDAMGWHADDEPELSPPPLSPPSASAPPATSACGPSPARANAPLLLLAPASCPLVLAIASRSTSPCTTAICC